MKNRCIRKRSGVVNIIARITMFHFYKENFLLKYQDINEWITRNLKWISKPTKKDNGRLQNGWTDDKEISGGDWIQTTKGRDLWKKLREA